MKIDYVSPEYTSVKCGIRKKDSSKLGLTFATLWTIACQVPLSMHSPGKSTGVGCHALLQIFLSQGSNPPISSLTFQADSLPLTHQEMSCSIFGQYIKDYNLIIISHLQY